MWVTAAVSASEALVSVRKSRRRCRSVRLAPVFIRPSVGGPGRSLQVAKASDTRTRGVSVARTATGIDGRSGTACWLTCRFLRLVTVDLDRSSAARVCDWLIGGYENYVVDREPGKQTLAAFPAWAVLVHMTWDFVAHAVSYCHAQGVRQFLDLGCGLALTANVHDLADRYDASSWCVYVELEPVAATSMMIMAEQRCDPTRHMVLQADLRDGHLVVDAFQPNGILDPDLPTAISASSVLHHIEPADGAETAVARLRDAVPRGSCLIATHLTTHGVLPDVASQLEQLRQLYADVNPPLYYRTLTGFCRVPRRSGPIQTRHHMASSMVGRARGGDHGLAGGSRRIRAPCRDRTQALSADGNNVETTSERTQAVTDLMNDAFFSLH